MKNILSTVLATTEAVAETGQAPASFLDDPLLPLYLLSAVMVLLLILVAAVTIYAIRILNILTKQAQPVVRHSWWQRFIERMNASVPVEQEKDIELDHDYDGIRELDNHLPPWWKWLFYGTIGFSAVYLVVYHVTDTLPLSHDEYKREVTMAEEAVRKYLASQPQTTIDENTLEYSADPEAIEKGRNIFMNNNCGGCHRNDGGGNQIGPNLADEYWLHGGDVKDIFRTIKNGVVEKGMPAWGKSMSAQDVRDVTFFVMSLQGTNPPDAKAPQGELFRRVNADEDGAQAQSGL